MRATIPPSAPCAPGTSPSRRRSRLARAAILGLLLGLGAGGCGPTAPPPSRELPADDSWFWRDVLAEPAADEAPPRHDLLALEPPSAVTDALAALRREGDAAALTTLGAALRDPRTGVAVLAARELGLLGDPAALPRLLKSIGPFPVDYDVPPEVRAAAAAALARLGNPAGIPLVLDMLAEGTELQLPRDQLPWVETTRMAFIQELALEALVALAGQDFGFSPNASVPEREAALAAARAWWAGNAERLWTATTPLPDDPGLVERIRLLIQNLRAYQLRQIDGARFTLAGLGPGVLPYLQEGLLGADAYQRMHVLEVMERLAGVSDRKGRGRLAVVAAGPLLQDGSQEVAAQAARVCGAAAVADPLVNALQQRAEPGVLVAVVDALGATGVAGMDAVLERWWTARGDSPASADLRAAVEGARLALDPQRSPEALLALLASPDPDVAFPAVERLLLLTGSDAGVDPLQPPVERGDALAAARAALLDRARRPADGARR